MEFTRADQETLRQSGEFYDDPFASPLRVDGDEEYVSAHSAPTEPNWTFGAANPNNTYGEETAHPYSDDREPYDIKRDPRPWETHEWSEEARQEFMRNAMWDEYAGEWTPRASQTHSIDITFNPAGVSVRGTTEQGVIAAVGLAGSMASHAAEQRQLETKQFPQLQAAAQRRALEARPTTPQPPARHEQPPVTRPHEGPYAKATVEIVDSEAATHATRSTAPQQSAAPSQNNTPSPERNSSPRRRAVFALAAIVLVAGAGYKPVNDFADGFVKSSGSTSPWTDIPKAIGGLW